MNKNLALGISLMLISEISFASMWALIKFVGLDIPCFEIIFFRAIITVILVATLIIAKRGTFRIKNKPVLLGRALLGSVAMFLAFYSLTKISLGNTATLLHTSPIFVAVLAPLILKERSKRSLLLWVIIAFVGAMLVVKPDQNIFQNEALLALAAGFFASLAYISIRHLHKTDNTATITFYFLLIVSLLSLPLMLANFVPPSPSQWIVLIAIGTLGTFAQLFLTYAYKCGQANIITPLNNSAIIFSFIYGWFIFGEIPDVYTAIGSIIIIISIVIISHTANRDMIKEELPRVGEG